MLDSAQGSLVGLNPTDGADEVRQRTGLIKKSSALVLDQFGDPGDGRSEHKFFVGHGLHQDYRDSFALAGHDDEVGVAVMAGKVGARHVTEKVNTPFEPRRHDLAFEGRAIWPLADDPADEIEALIAQRGAGLDKEAIILHSMQASNGEETEPSMVGLDGEGGCGPGKNAIDPQALHEDFVCGRGGVIAENVLAVEVGDGYAKLASAQLGREQVRALQQIGAVQGKTEADSEQTGGGQGHP